MDSLQVTRTQIEREIAAHNWWHKIDLGYGIVTPGIDVTPEKIEAIKLPERLDGQTVLDIGAWDGAFSFECERRGAADVLATDWFVWRNGNRKGFDIAHRLLASKVRALEVKVEDILERGLGKFDVVLFLGVLYHAENPMLYLHTVRESCQKMAIIETVVDALDYPRPAVVYYPGATLNNDASNFWGPNQLAVEAMLRDVGFARVEKVTTWLGNRMVFHAYI